FAQWDRCRFGSAHAVRITEKREKNRGESGQQSSAPLAGFPAPDYYRITQVTITYRLDFTRRSLDGHRIRSQPDRNAQPQPVAGTGPVGRVDTQSAVPFCRPARPGPRTASARLADAVPDQSTLPGSCQRPSPRTLPAARTTRRGRHGTGLQGPRDAPGPRGRP